MPRPRLRSASSLALVALVASLGCDADGRRPPPPIPADDFPLELSVSGNDSEWRGTLHVAAHDGVVRLELHGRHYHSDANTVNAGGPFVELGVEGRPQLDGVFVTTGVLLGDFGLSHARSTSGGVVYDTLVVRSVSETELVLADGVASGFVVVTGTYQGAPDVAGEARIDIMGPVECHPTTDVPIELADGTPGTMRCPAVTGQPLFVAQ